MATLADIRRKVRLITRSPSASQLTNDNIDQYVNDFLLYDFPENIRLTVFRKTLSFFTTPYVDQYSTNTIRDDDPLYDFKNAHITSHDPVFVAGYKAYFTQSRNDFFGLYPAIQRASSIGTGDGATVLFTGTLNTHPVLQNNVLFSSIDANNEAVYLKDVPQIDAATGLPEVEGDLVWPDSAVSSGTINYYTGVYSLTFNVAPADGMPIYAQVVGYSAGRPTSLLYFDTTFTVRPVPDKTYQITIETYVQPDELSDANIYPELDQHWTYIALGAARRIFTDRMDMESLQMIEPLYQEQEMLCQRRTIVQSSNNRVATIYTQQVDPTYGNGTINNYP